MTKVRFTFVDVQGNPLPLLEFKILLRRASFNIEDLGVALPEELNVTTDASGQVIVELWPLKAAYRVQVADEYEELCGKLNWSFYVPQTDEVVEAQSLFLVPAPSNVPWDEEAMGKITQAVIDTHDNAVAADVSADRAELAAQTIEGDANRAEAAAAEADASKNAAAVSAQASAGSATASDQSAADALASENAAASSANAANNSAVSASADAGRAAASATAAAGSATTATNSKDAAAASAAAALASKNSAETAAGTATTKAGEAATSANNASGSASAAAGSASTALTQADRAKTEADRATAATDGKQPLSTNLTAFAGLAGAADRLPYFTGAGPMGITSFTSKGRELVGQADEAAMRTFMGLVPVTTNNDVTASRLLNVGYGGLGGLPITLANANDVASKSGMECVFYGTEASSVTGNYPVLGGTSTAVRIWYSKVVLIASDSGYQIAVEGVGTGTTRGRRFKRILYGTWGPWVEDINLPQYGYAANDGADLPGGSWNGILLSGNYRFVPGNTNGPGTGINYGTVTRNAYQISSGTWTEFTQSAQEPRAWIRQSINNSSGNHYEIYTRYNALNDPQTDAATAGLLSATGISGFGVFKYANGQMCIIGPGTITPSCPANGTVLHTVTIPSGLINNATYTAITGRAIPQANQDHFGVVSATQPTATTIQLSIRNGPTGAQTFGTQICVWGQWK